MTTIKPNFEQVNICGAYLPPNSSINAVLAKIGKGKVKLPPDEIISAKHLFCDLSNEYTAMLDIKFNPVKHLLLGNNDDITIKLMGLDFEWLAMLKTQSELVQRDYSQLVQCLFVIEWYRFLVGDMGVINTPKMAEEISKLLNVWYCKKTRDKYSPSWKLKEYKPHLDEFEDFSIAREFLDDYYSLVMENIGYGFVRIRTPEIDRGISHLQQLHISMYEIDSDRIKVAQALRVKNTVLGFCSNCMTNYFYNRGASSLCSRNECQKAYSVRIKSISRSKREYCEFCETNRVLTNGVCRKCRKS